MSGQATGLLSWFFHPNPEVKKEGAFDTLTWRSLTDEYWNGFTVGVQSTAVEQNPPPTGVPSPATWLLMIAGGAGMLASRRGRKTRL